MADFDPIASGQAIGQGLAQVFGPFEDKYSVKAAEMKVKSAEAAAKKAEKTQSDLLEKIGKAKAIDILAGDQPKFANWQKEIYDWTKENIDKLSGGDVAATLEFNNKLNDFALKAAHSKDYREKHQQIGQTLMTNQEEYNPDSNKVWLTQGSSSFDEKGNFRDVDITQYKKKEEPFDVIKFYDSIKYDPSEKITVIEDPRTGQVIETGRQFYKNPNSIAEDMLQNPKYQALATVNVNALPEEERIALQERAASPNETGNVYKQYAKEEFLKRKGLKETDKERYETKPVPRARAIRGAEKVTFDVPQSANITNYQRMYKTDSGELQDVKQFNTPAYTLPLTKELNIQLTASKVYNPVPSKNYVDEYGEPIKENVGTWLDKQFNGKIDFGNINYVPTVKGKDGKERFLTANEVKTLQTEGSKKQINPSSIYMKPVIPSTENGEPRYFDATENQVKRKIETVLKRPIPPWSEVWPQLESQGVQVPSWSKTGGGGKVVPKADQGKIKDSTNLKGGQAKKYNIKGKDYSYEQVNKAAEQSGMSVDEYVKELNKLQ